MCGFDEPDAALILEKSETAKWKLLIKGNDAHSLLWSGPRCSSSRAHEYFGIEEVGSIDEIGELIKKFDQEGGPLFADTELANSCLTGDALSIMEGSRTKSVRGIIDSMRLIKSPAEQQIMGQVGQLAATSFAETIKWAVRGGTRKEADLAAKMEFECRLRGASGMAYVPVVAGGDRANIIHYVRNDRLIQYGRLEFVKYKKSNFIFRSS